MEARSDRGGSESRTVNRDDDELEVPDLASTRNRNPKADSRTVRPFELPEATCLA